MIPVSNENRADEFPVYRYDCHVQVIKIDYLFALMNVIWVISNIEYLKEIIALS